MNTTARTSLVAFLAIIPMAVMTGCSNSTPGVANPAVTTSSSTAASPSPTPPTPPSSVTTVPTPSISSAQPTPAAPNSAQPSSPEPSSEEPTPRGPTALPTDLSGEVHGFIRAVDVQQSQITLDKIDWFTGAAAEQACAEDGVPEEAHLDGWCTVYYFRNVNPALRVVTVSPEAAITTFEGNNPVSSDFSTLADRAAMQMGNYRPYRMVVTDGAIVELSEIFQP